MVSMYNDLTQSRVYWFFFLFFFERRLFIYQQFGTCLENDNTNPFAALAKQDMSFIHSGVLSSINAR